MNRAECSSPVGNVIYLVNNWGGGTTPLPGKSTARRPRESTRGQRAASFLGLSEWRDVSSWDGLKSAYILVAEAGTPEPPKHTQRAGLRILTISDLL